VVWLDGIRINEKLLHRIVFCVNKAVADDVPQYLGEHYKETNNAVAHLRGDFINDNLKNYVVKENVELLSFSRSSWQGRIIVDHERKVTYTITTQQTLRTIPKKQRSRPHYLHTLLYKENGEYEGYGKQLTMMDIYPFEDEVLERDYEAIISGQISPEDGYVHYVVVYETQNSELIDIQLEFIDKDFKTIANASLNEYKKPDFARLTDVELVYEGFYDNIEEEKEGLVYLKHDLRLKENKGQKKA
jgi:hypothetical protein